MAVGEITHENRTAGVRVARPSLDMGGGGRGVFYVKDVNSLCVNKNGILSIRLILLIRNYSDYRPIIQAPGSPFSALSTHLRRWKDAKEH